MKKNYPIFLRHILQCATWIEKHTKNIDDPEKEEYEIIYLAVIRQIEVIGEATRNIPQEIRAKYSEIPWKEMAGMRDVLIHHYYGVSSKRVWKVVKNEIPKLKKQIQQIIEDLESKL